MPSCSTASQSPRTADALRQPVGGYYIAAHKFHAASDSSCYTYTHTQEASSMTESMRITTNNSRRSAGGRVYSPRHNDRTFSVENAPHINHARTADNWEWTWLENDGVLCSFEDAEREYYARHISDHLQAVNRRYEAQRHSERVRSLDEYRRAPQSCPEETIVCIGNREHHPDPSELLAAYLELQHWQQKQFPQLHVLDYAMHLDEQGAPHIHERHVWTYTDADGHMAIGQARALEQMGVQRPHPEQPRSRYNNAKVTYTAMVRKQFVEICRQRGLEIEITPRERSQSGLTLLEYQSRQEEQHLQELQREITSLEIDRLLNAITPSPEEEQAQEQLYELQQQCQDMQMQTQTLQEQRDKLQQQCQDMQMQTQTLQEQTTTLQLQNQALQMQRQEEYKKLQQTTARRQAVSKQVRAANRDLRELQAYTTDAQQRRAATIEQATRDREQRPLSRSYDDYDDREH